MAERAETGQGGASVSRVVMVTELVEVVLAAVAPDELELLPEVTAAWRAGDLAGVKGGKWLGGSVGFGVDPGLTVMVIYPIITGAMSQLIGTAATSGWQRLVNRLRRRRPKPPMVLSSTVLDKAEQMRAVCFSQALAVGLPEARATLIADAVYGYLMRTAAADPGSDPVSGQ